MNLDACADHGSDCASPFLLLQHEMSSMLALFGNAQPRSSWSLFSILSSVACFVGLGSVVQAQNVRITVENIGTVQVPNVATSTTSVFAGFHDGSFDLFDVGSAASAQLEMLAEDGDNSGLQTLFDPTGITGRSIGNIPLFPGNSGFEDFTIDLNSPSSQRLVLATMLLPSNDVFLSSGDPDAFDLTNLSNGPVEFTLNRLYDAGTEVNDFATSAGNGVLGVSGGQGGPNIGLDENGTVQFIGTIQADGTVIDGGGQVIDPFANYANLPANFSPSLSPIRVTVTAVPEPTAGLAVGVFAVGLLARRRRTRQGQATTQSS
ncbi:MAG: spondin domain-containing protein [Planctomycetota bacterium]